MKVISFKVNDDVYNGLKKKKVSFRALFEPLAIQLVQKNRRGMKYTVGIRKNSGDLYQNLVLIQKTIDKIMKFRNFKKNESKDIDIGVKP